jgi:hypothetical protein
MEKSGCATGKSRAEDPNDRKRPNKEKKENIRR